jgi:hypothetical protein
MFTILVLWLIDPLLGKDLKANNEYSHCYATGQINKWSFLSNSLVKTFPQKQLRMQQKNIVLDVILAEEQSSSVEGRQFS